MRVRRTLLGLAAATTMVGALSSTASAGGDEPVFDVDYSCDGAAYITVTVDSAAVEAYDVVIGDQVFEDVVNDEVTASPFDNGFVPVDIYVAGTSDVVYAVTVPIGCGEPFVAIDLQCLDNGTRLYINIADETAWDYDVYVDDTDTPVDGWENITDTDWRWDEVGVYPPGEHTVYVVWYQNPSDGYIFQETFGAECGDDDGSGGGLPDSGSESTTLMLIAGGLMALGAGLMIARRARLA